MVLSLLVILLKITCVLLIALCATLAMQRASAGSRHLVWLLALAALLVVPAVAVWAPLEVAVLPQVTTGETGEMGGAGRMGEMGKMGGLNAVDAPSIPASPATSGPAITDSPIQPIQPILPILFGIWGIVAAALAIRLLMGAMAVRRIVRRAQPLDDAKWQTPLYEIADRLGLDAAPRLLRSSDVKMPFAAGLARATIVLPAESDEWTADRRSAVLVHELGHVRRRDLIGHTLGRIACALYWFHPLVWTAARRLRAESEQACDDLALTFGARPSDYAEHLLDIVTCVRDHNTPSVALAMAHRKEFEGRMLAILNPELRRRGPSRAQGASYAFALAGMALLIGAVMPVEKQVAGHESRVAENAERSALSAQDSMADAGLETQDTEPAPSPQPQARSSTRDPRLVTRDAQRPTPDAERMTRIEADVNAHISTTINIPEIVNRALGGRTTQLAGDTAVVRALIERLRDDDAEVRQAAAYALGRIGDPMAIPELVKALDDPQPRVQEAALDALSEFERGVPVAPVQRMLASNNADMRQHAVYILMNMHAMASLPAISGLVSDPDADVRQSAIEAIQEMGSPSAAGTVLPALGDRDADVRQAAVYALAQLGGSIPEAALDKLLQDSSEDVRQATVQYISERRITGKTAQLIRLLDDPSDDVRQSAAEALTEMRTPESHAALRRALTNADADVRRTAVEYFGEEGDQ
jgi:HEAT repeat protein/beta-lactamase regulating signal transducer with metallopeptidase domain